MAAVASRPEFCKDWLIPFTRFSNAGLPLWVWRTSVFWFCWTSNDEIPYGAYTSPSGLGSGWGNYQYSTIAFNRYTMDGLTDFMKLKVATRNRLRGADHPVEGP